MIWRAYLNETALGKTVGYVAGPTVKSAVIGGVVSPMWGSQHRKLEETKVARLASVGHDLPLHKGCPRWVSNDSRQDVAPWPNRRATAALIWAT